MRPSAAVDALEVLRVVQCTTRVCAHTCTPAHAGCRARSSSVQKQHDKKTSNRLQRTRTQPCRTTASPQTRAGVCGETSTATQLDASCFRARVVRQTVQFGNLPASSLASRPIRCSLTKQAQQPAAVMTRPTERCEARATRAIARQRVAASCSMQST